MPFRTDNPFNLSDWNNIADVGANESGDEVQMGDLNVAGDNDTTEFGVRAADNAALIGNNIERNHGGVGVHGHSWCGSYGIGTSGCCATGVGVYGISNIGVGAVGRVMADGEVESAPLEELAPHVGVLAQSVIGVALRGHGGPGFRSPSPEDERRPRPIGAVFSAGELQDAHIPGGVGIHEVSVEPAAQMQIIPSQSDTLPVEGRLGDFFLAIRSDMPARLFICTKLSGSTAMWQEVQLQSTFLPSGASI